MSTTTPATIRTSIAARIVALTPTIESSVPFRQHVELDDFRAWCAANPAGCLRRFSVRQAGSVEVPRVSDGYSAEWVFQDFEVVVAYPSDGRFGSRRIADLDNVIDRDRLQIANAAGTNGTAYTDATVTTEREEREDAGPVTFGVLTLRAGYFRVARSA